MAAIGRFQKGDAIFHAKVVDGEIYPLKGDVFGSPSFEKKPMKLKGVRTLAPVTPSKIIAVGLNYADHARESGKPVPQQPLIWIKATTSMPRNPATTSSATPPVSFRFSRTVARSTAARTTESRIVFLSILSRAAVS